MNINVKKNNAFWILPSIAIAAVLAFFTIQYIMADDMHGDVQSSYVYANPAGQIDPMDMLREILAIDRPDCGNVCEHCIEELAMMQLWFSEWNLPHRAYLDDFDYLVAMLTTNTPKFYDVMPYADAARIRLEKLKHINDTIFWSFLIREFSLGFLRDLDLPTWPLPITQIEDMYGDFAEFLASGAVADMDFVVLPNSNIAVFLPRC